MNKKLRLKSEKHERFMEGIPISELNGSVMQAVIWIDIVEETIDFTVEVQLHHILLQYVASIKFLL